ncbi:hypothetical protein CR513_02956, partial [Mucuna pruriens]
MKSSTNIGNFPSANSATTSPVNFRHQTDLSARKLAARLWHFRFSEPSSFPNSKLQSSFPPRGKTRSRKLIGDSPVSILLAELLRAQTCINNLKAEHKAFKKKLYEQNLLWKRREIQKSEATLEDLKDKLVRERRSRERMESLNAKLLHDLAQAKLYAKQFMVNYEEEKRKRQVTEEVCNELAMQIGEDKVKLEELQRHSMRIREEMEEERKVFHMIEMWREESIQMKLLDAKLALEDKYNQMIHLIAHLQSFLRSRTDQVLNVDQLSRDFTNLTHVFEDLQIKERVIQVEPYYPSNLNLHIGPSSTVQILSLDENINNGFGSEDVEDGCFERCDSVAQQNSEDPTCEGRLAIKRSGIGSTFMCKGSCESGFRQWERNFADSVNPHITRGMKGCIEWPRGIPKINSKVIPLEDRVRKQKSQLQHILKPQAQDHVSKRIKYRNRFE